MFPQINNILLLVEKASFILGSVFYLIFALVIVKQNSMMSKNVNDKFNAILITISIFHLIAAGILVFLTITIL